jgi:D-sedoheptulose 7-phosphate isomerase
MSHVQASIAQAAQTMESLRALEDNILRAADLVKGCLAKGGKLLACGNGGSAADASDFTTEYVCRFINDRQPFPAINLTADGGLLTATANDYGFEEVFARQVRAFGKTGDVVIALSTSGKSKNILRALEEARRLQLGSIALLGKDGGDAKGLATVDLIVPSQVTARIQEAHKFILHLVCELVDPSLKK